MIVSGDIDINQICRYHIHMSHLVHIITTLSTLKGETRTKLVKRCIRLRASLKRLNAVGVHG